MIAGEHADEQRAGARGHGHRAVARDVGRHRNRAGRDDDGIRLLGRHGGRRRFGLEPDLHAELFDLTDEVVDHPPHLLVVRHVLGQPDLATERVTLLEDRHAMAALRGHTGGLES